MSEQTNKIYYQGKVGIGTENPDHDLTIAGDNAAYVALKANNQGQVALLGADNSGAVVAAVGNHDLQLRAGGNDTKVIIKASGDVGIGTTSPQSRLHVTGGSSFQAGRNYFSDEEGRGRLRVGAAWGVPGIYSEDSQNIIVGTGAGNKVLLGSDPNFVTVNAGSGNLGIGTTEPGDKVHVEGGFVKVRVFAPDDSTQANGGFALESREAGGHTHNWKLYTASVGGGWGVVPNGFSIWDYPQNGAGGSFERFSMAPSAYGVQPAPVYIDSRGNMGIGNKNPEQKLEVSGSIAVGHRWSDGSNTQSICIGKPDYLGAWGPGAAFIRINDKAGNQGELHAGTEMAFHTHAWAGGTNQHMIITALGNIGVGTNDPEYKLDVNGTVRANTVVPSDARIKTQIEPLQNSLETICRLQGVSYELKNDPDKTRQIGFIAQQVEQVVPELVHTDSTGLKALAYDRITALLTEAIKELKNENEKLKSRIEVLERIGSVAKM